MAAAGAGRAVLDRIGRYWRVFATGFSFFIFGVGGLVLRIGFFPLLNIFIWNTRLRITIARQTIRFAFRSFIGLMHALGVLRYEITGLERLGRGGMLILANHPTLIDTVFLMAFVRHADCLVNSKLWSNPFTRGPIRAAGYISNQSGAGLMADCIASLRAGGNLIVFPEGTRTPGNGKITLQRGAANIAVRGACNVTPVVIRCTPPTLGKGEKWWRVPATRARFTIAVQEDIDIRPIVAAAGSEVLAARCLTDYLQNYFIKEKDRHAVA